METKLVNLQGLEKIYKIVLFKNNTTEYIKNVLYRVFIFPFKKKNDRITFFLDGFVGYYPLQLANVGSPDEINFYEEGESIYCKNVLFKKGKTIGLKQIVNELIKKTLFIRANSIFDVRNFYVRDKSRLANLLRLENVTHLNCDIQEVNDIECIRALSETDKEILKKVFFSDVQFDFSLQDDEKGRAIVLTQPTYLFGIHTKEEAVDLFNSQILKLQKEKYKVYLKIHPKEKDDIYIRDNVQRLSGRFPFEFLALYDIVFDKGVSYNSTAINSCLIKQKIMLKDEVAY
ncbi:polysialyltransferase family glycosyltransferase [Kluyvera georgiana]|uniref:polysialyltransferase family glycosyltransferase n=1 Tax=Kluyvera georgiana TaxID=73098 RepID=UPI003D951B0D